MVTLTDREGGVLPLPALEPPEQIQYQFESAHLIKTLITNGTITYTVDGLQQWLTSGVSARDNRERHRQMQATKQLLGGQKLDQYELCYQAAYALAIAHNPAGQASILVARAGVLGGAVVAGLHPLLLPVVLQERGVVLGGRFLAGGSPVGEEQIAMT